MGEHRFEAPAEVAEVIAVLVHLHALAVVLDLGVHPVGTLLHGILNGLAGLSLGERASKTQLGRNSREMGPLGDVQNMIYCFQFREG